jgi:hypothetical protein
MSNIDIIKKFDQLPYNLKVEADDFINFLLEKHHKTQQKIAMKKKNGHSKHPVFAQDFEETSLENLFHL